VRGWFFAAQALLERVDALPALLLERGREASSVLHLAVARADLRLTELLLRTPGGPECLLPLLDAWHRTPLRLAARLAVQAEPGAPLEHRLAVLRTLLHASCPRAVFLFLLFSLFRILLLLRDFC
jgi:hypothetical protein